MTRKDIVLFYIPGFTLMGLLLILYWLSFNILKKLESIDNKITVKINEMQKQMDGLEKKTEFLEKTIPLAQTSNSEKKKSRGIPFPLTPDPYFQNLPRGKSSQQTVMIALSNEEKGFNRLLENSAQLVEWHDYYYNDFLAQRHWNDPDKWAPHLATSIEISSDNREFTIHLREGVRWHKPLVDWSNPRYAWLNKEHYVTSDDFAFAYFTIMNPKVKAQHLQSSYNEIESFSVIDDYTFVIRWKKTLYTNLVFTLEQFPIPEFLYAYNEDGEKVSADRFADNINEHWYNNRMIGCGPYIFTKHIPGELVEFVRNEEYYGYRPAIQKVQFALVKDSDIAYQKLLDGEIDIIPQLSENTYKKIINPKDKIHFKGKLKDKPNIQIYSRAVYYHIKWNNAHPIFQDKMVRRAMTYAMDRETFLKTIFMDLGTIATADIHPDFHYYNPNLKPYPYDLAKAREILEQQGWRDEDGDGIREKVIAGKLVKFVFTLYYANRSDDSNTQMYTRYSQALKEIGVKMIPKEVERSELLRRSETKEFEALHGGWLTDLPLVDFYQIWHSSFADQLYSSNEIRFKNVEADLICQKMREATLPEERIKLAYRMQEILHEEQPYTFLFFTKGVAVFHPRIQNPLIRKVRPYVLIHPYVIN